jgi:NAD(P)-dependent dehydrogenase (short-subunit alcohol dehydrogenase family)
MTDSIATAPPVLDRFRLDGRVALVTGAGNGIGRGIAYALGEAGAAVAVADLRTDSAETVANELEAKGIDAIAVTLDAADPDSASEAVAVVVGHWGSLTIGVNNAGIFGYGDTIDVTPQEWRRIMAVNLDGVFYCAQAEARAMREAGYGKIINTASMAGRIITRYSGPEIPYCVSKAAVLQLTRGLAVDWAKYGIRVNALSPGYTENISTEAVLATEEGRAHLELLFETNPLVGLVPPADLQGAAVYLASAASDSTTGLDLLIDRGHTLW